MTSFPIWMRFAARLCSRAWESVLMAQNSTPWVVAAAGLGC